MPAQQDSGADNIVHGIFAGEDAARENEYRLERAIGRLRRLLNDPDALQRRVFALLDGTAKPILCALFIGVTAIRLTVGPITPGYFNVCTHRKEAAQMAAFAFQPDNAPSIG